MNSIKTFIRKIKEGKLKKLFSEFIWMYTYVRRYWLMIIIYVLLGASGSLLGLGTSVVSKDLVDAVTGVNTRDIVSVAVLYVGVGVSQIFINAVKTRISLKIRLKVTNEIREDIYGQILHTDWESLAKFRSGDLLYRINGDAGMIANSILTFLPNAVSMFISFGGAFVIVMQNDPAMAVLALAGAPISLLASRYTTKKMRDFQKENQELASDRTVFDQETFQNLQFIKAFGMLDRVTEKFHKIQNESVKVSLRQNKFQSHVIDFYVSCGTGHRLCLLRLCSLQTLAGRDQLRYDDHVRIHGRFFERIIFRHYRPAAHGHPGGHQRRAYYGSD